MSRRRVLRTAAAAGLIPSIGTAVGKEGSDFVLGGDTAGREGREPEAIADEVNPTLNLEEGGTHVLEWENVDGQATIS